MAAEAVGAEAPEAGKDGGDGQPLRAVSGPSTGRDAGDCGPGGWAAQGAGPTQESSRAPASIHAQVDRSIDSALDTPVNPRCHDGIGRSDMAGSRDLSTGMGGPDDDDFAGRAGFPDSACRQ